jgi:tetratricopeptide (TPR) repeat protein
MSFRKIIIFISSILILLFPPIVFDKLKAEGNSPDRKKLNLYCPSKQNRAIDYFDKATNLSKQKSAKELVNLYLKAIELDPGFCDAMDNLGNIYQKAGKSDEAIYWHQKAIETNMKDTVAHINLATDFRLQNRLRESADEYKMAIEIEPQNPEGYFGLGSDYLTIGKSEEALHELKIAEKLYLEMKSPYLAHARYSIGLAHFFLNDCASAKLYLEPIYQEFKTDPNINYSLGVCYLRAKEIDKGKSYLQNAKSQGMEQAENVLEMIENGDFQ